LYRAAEEAAKAVPFDVFPNKMEAAIQARAKAPLAIRLRNWSGSPRTWKASSSQEWLTLERVSGQLSGQEVLNVFVDSAKLKSGETTAATVSITDEAAGKTHTVEIAATAGSIFEFVVGEAYNFLATPAHAYSWGPKRIDDHAVFNVTCGGDEMREFTLVNRSGSPLEWKIESPAQWLKAEPAAGTLAGHQRAYVRIVARPTDTQAARHETLLKITEARGEHAQSVKIVTHVIPLYQAPALPGGEPVAASTLLPKDRVKSHKARFYWYGTSAPMAYPDPQSELYGPKFSEKGNISGGVEQETVYKLEGAGFSAFSAKVQVDPGLIKATDTPDLLYKRLVNFELHVDGKLVAQSGLVKSGDEPRLLVADGLANAKELKLVTRFDTPEPKNLLGTPGMAWLEPIFYKAK